VEIVLVIIGALAGLGLGAWAGLKWGVALMSSSPWKYWAANVVMLLAGLTVAVLGQYVGQLGLAVAGLGVAAGGITGLKYGLGRSPGVWAVHDRLLGNDPDMRDD
jgi:hypothetical protein